MHSRQKTPQDPSQENSKQSTRRKRAKSVTTKIFNDIDCHNLLLPHFYDRMSNDTSKSKIDSPLLPGETIEAVFEKVGFVFGPNVFSEISSPRQLQMCMIGLGDIRITNYRLIFQYVESYNKDPFKPHEDVEKDYLKFINPDQENNPMKTMKNYEGMNGNLNQKKKESKNASLSTFLDYISHGMTASFEKKVFNPEDYQACLTIPEKKVVNPEEYQASLPFPEEFNKKKIQFNGLNHQLCQQFNSYSTNPKNLIKGIVTITTKHFKMWHLVFFDEKILDEFEKKTTEIWEEMKSVEKLFATSFYDANHHASVAKLSSASEKSEDNETSIESPRDMISTPFLPFVYPSSSNDFIFRSEDIKQGWRVYDPTIEFKRQKAIEEDSSKPNWRISEINKEYKICSSYPSILIVPKSIDDETLKGVASFRSKKRIPALSYLHRNGASITRSSQPNAGFFSSRCPEDEMLLEGILKTTPEDSTLHIIDARPYENAMGNYAVGKGFENTKNYTCSKIEFMKVPNIHTMSASLRTFRKWVFSALENGSSFQLGDDTQDRFKNKEDENYYAFSMLEKSNWLHHIHTILKSSYKIVDILEKNCPVLVHCSDGWDRTSQLVALPQIICDPFFRTMEGFAVLVEKDWVSFGYKFSDRSAHLETKKSNFYYNVSKEFSPIFHQFIECVYHLWKMFPKSFEFNENYLIALLDFSMDPIFGNFLYNTVKERNPPDDAIKQVSVWTFFKVHSQSFKNPYYDEKDSKGILIPTSIELTTLMSNFWNKYYFRFSFSYNSMLMRNKDVTIMEKNVMSLLQNEQRLEQSLIEKDQELKKKDEQLKEKDQEIEDLQNKVSNLQTEVANFKASLKKVRLTNQKLENQILCSNGDEDGKSISMRDECDHCIVSMYEIEEEKDTRLIKQTKPTENYFK